MEVLVTVASEPVERTFESKNRDGSTRMSKCVDVILDGGLNQYTASAFDYDKSTFPPKGSLILAELQFSVRMTKSADGAERAFQSIRIGRFHTMSTPE